MFGLAYQCMWLIFRSLKDFTKISVHHLRVPIPLSPGLLSLPRCHISLQVVESKVVDYWICLLFLLPELVLFNSPSFFGFT